MSDHKLAGTRIGIFGKGGAGKSTVTVLLAKSLRTRSYPVCVIDADSTNVGLDQALGVSTRPVPLMKFFGGTVFGGGRVSCPVDDPTPLPGASLSLEQIPKEYRGTTPDGILYLAAGKIGEEAPGSGCDGPISKIVRDVRIVRTGAPYVTLIDFKAGFEDVARGVIASLSQVLVVVDPTNAALQMALDMKRTVQLMRSGVRPATRHLQNPALIEFANRNFERAELSAFFVVLNRVREPRVEEALLRRLRVNGIEPVAVIPEHSSIADAWLDGVPLQVPDTSAVDVTVREMERASTSSLLKKEIAR